MKYCLLDATLLYFTLNNNQSIKYYPFINGATFRLHYLLFFKLVLINNTANRIDDLLFSMITANHIGDLIVSVFTANHIGDLIVSMITANHIDDLIVSVITANHIDD
jgi:hypothetical protein